MGAIRIDSNNFAITNPINLINTTIIDSPYSAIELVSGNGGGLGISGLTINGANIDGVGTVVFQAETTGSASVSGVTASDVGVPGAYNESYPGNNSGAYDFNLGSGNSGWSTTPTLTTFPNAVTPNATPTIGNGGAADSGSPSTAASAAASSASPSSPAGDSASASSSVSDSASATATGTGTGAGTGTRHRK